MTPLHTHLPPWWSRRHTWAILHKLVLVAPGTSGVMTWSARAQPLLALAAAVGLGWALRSRWRGRLACSAPTDRLAVAA